MQRIIDMVYCRCSLLSICCTYWCKRIDKKLLFCNNNVPILNLNCATHDDNGLFNYGQVLPVETLVQYSIHKENFLTNNTETK